MPKGRPCAKCGKRRQEQFFATPRARTCRDCKRKSSRKFNRTTHLKDTYDLTHEDYDQLLAAQNGVCAICHGKRTYNLCVDHDHKKPWGKESVRGLLCRLCNGRLLTSAKDDPAILRRAAAYLEDPPAQRLL